MATYTWNTTTPDVLSNPLAWLPNGTPGVGDKIVMPSKHAMSGLPTGQCTVDVDVIVDYVQSSGLFLETIPTLSIASGVTLSTIYISNSGFAGNPNIEVAGKLVISGGAAAFNLVGTACNEIEVTNSTAVASKVTSVPITSLKMIGASTIQGAWGQVLSLDVSGITAVSHIQSATMYIAAGATLTMPATPSHLHVGSSNAGSGGNIYVIGGTDDGGNTKWIFTLPHTTTGSLVGAGSSVVGAANSATGRISSGALVGGGAVIAGTCIRPPTVTSLDPAFSYIGANFNYQIVASRTPTSYGATGLPPGLTVSTVTGLITGIPTTSGYYSVVLGATNAGGTGTKTILVQIEIPEALEVP